MSQVMERLDAAMEEAWGRLDDAQRDHFKTVCSALLSAFIDDSMHALVILGTDDPERPAHVEVVQIMAVNATDINSMQLVGGAMNQLGTVVMADAPPREMFN